MVAGVQRAVQSFSERRSVVGDASCRSLDLIGRARKLAPMDSKYVTESAHERVLLGDLRQANEEFKQGASLDDANVQAVTGMIFCQLSSGQLLDALRALYGSMYPPYMNPVHKPRPQFGPH